MVIGLNIIANFLESDFWTPPPRAPLSILYMDLKCKTYVATALGPEGVFNLTLDRSARPRKCLNLTINKY